MLDTIFTVSGKTLHHNGQSYRIDSAGIRDDRPFAAVTPHSDTVVEAIVRHIQRFMPLPFSLDEVQADLAQ